MPNEDIFRLLQHCNINHTFAIHSSFPHLVLHNISYFFFYRMEKHSAKQLHTSCAAVIAVATAMTN